MVNTCCFLNSLFHPVWLLLFSQNKEKSFDSWFDFEVTEIVFFLAIFSKNNISKLCVYFGWFLSNIINSAFSIQSVQNFQFKQIEKLHKSPWVYSSKNTKSTQEEEILNIINFQHTTVLNLNSTLPCISFALSVKIISVGL